MISTFTPLPDLKGARVRQAPQGGGLQVLCSVGPETVCWDASLSSAELMRTKDILRTFWSKVGATDPWDYGPLPHSELTENFLDHMYPNGGQLEAGDTAGVFYIPTGESDETGRPLIGNHPFMMVGSTRVRLTSFLRCGKRAAIASKVIAHTSDRPADIAVNAELEWTTSLSEGSPMRPMAMKAALDEIKMPVERAKNRLLLANDIQVGVPVFCHKTDEVDSKYRVGTITFTKSLSLADMGAELVSLNFYGDPADLEEPDDDVYAMDPYY